MKTIHTCILQFDDPSPSFALGFQVGEIWAKMDTREEFALMFSGDVLEIVQRMAVRKNYTFDIQEAGVGWYSLHATPNARITLDS